MKWYIYMLKCGDDSIYTGSTNNIERRLKAHQSGKGAKYTKSHLPVKLVYSEELPDKSSALKREAEIKNMSRKEKLEIISKNGP